jgi:large subunit ribosomal protein L18
VKGEENNFMKDFNKIKREKRLKRQNRVRARIFGTAKKPRLTVFRSLKHIYAQLIDDTKGRTLAASSSLELKKNRLTSKEIPQEVGKILAKKAQAKKIKQVVFDRGGYLYHGQVKALAEGAKKGGLEF